MSKLLTWEVFSFEDLDIHRLYEILHLRAQVFVFEQNCPYLDPDKKDQKATHLLGYHEGKLVAYCRLFAPNDYFEEASIGRVVVAQHCRKYGFGHQLMDKAIALTKELLSESIITISAQLYLKQFYESHGFIQISDQYLEDDIPHIRMKRIENKI